MNKVAIYPGTFDPITYGHIDVIKKALKLFDGIVVGVSDVDNKDYLFNQWFNANISDRDRCFEFKYRSFNITLALLCRSMSCCHGALWTSKDQSPGKI